MSDSGEEAICNARALLHTFEGSALSEFHVRTEAFELFIAKAAGGANPMRDIVRAAPFPSEASSPSTDGLIVRAPHVATVVSLRGLGEHVDAGATVAELSLLDEVVHVTAPVSGMVEERLTAVGDLVEFETALVRLA